MTIDTIVAQSTPYGRSGVGILRISGFKTSDVSEKILGLLPPARQAYYATFLDNYGVAIDEGIAIWFPKPNSFTGEDVLELHAHGNPIILDLLMKSILLVKNVRIARPGEFSERAFLNGKIDLIQAESIIKLINATTESQVKFALKSLQGRFSEQIDYLINSIIDIRMLLEAVLNFPEEDCDIYDTQIEKKLKKILINIKNVYKNAKLGHIERDAIKIVISGQTNAGKSTIFNLLSCKNSAIITNIAGTTRDVLCENIQIKGVQIQLIDTAGFRKTDNIIEKIGISKAWEQVALSDHIFFVLDDTNNIFYQKQKITSFIKKIKYKNQVTIIINKCDLSHRKVGIRKYFSGRTYIMISAKYLSGIKILKQHLQSLVQKFMINNTETVFLTQRRHLNILRSIKKQVINLKENWFVFKNFELLAEDFKIIQNLLNEITGSITSNDILNSIFKNFCIGK
ncbi:tRNA modification GTPase MnmE [Buchnera aphidicola (Takecallis arundicolens)]|uniref:tRNA uridine-5-carboxymethylaminomethyl(34) synthesis GTPase MnmE n=1 Tax=Buchnera aphidicola TaxID=9 RepID=UPI0034648BAC